MPASIQWPRPSPPSCPRASLGNSLNPSLSTGARNRRQLEPCDLRHPPKMCADRCAGSALVRIFRVRERVIWSQATWWPFGAQGVARRCVQRTVRWTSLSSGTAHGSGSATVAAGPIVPTSSTPGLRRRPRRPASSHDAVEVGQIGEPAPVGHHQPVALERHDDGPVHPHHLLDAGMRLQIGGHQAVGDEVPVVGLVAELAAVGKSPLPAGQPREQTVVLPFPDESALEARAWS